MTTRSAWWFLLPLLFGIVGSAVAYSKLRTDDPELVKWIMIFGITQSIALALGTASGSVSPDILMQK